MPRCRSPGTACPPLRTDITGRARGRMARGLHLSAYTGMAPEGRVGVSPADRHSNPPADVPHPSDGEDSARRWFDAGEDQSHPALRCHVGLTFDGPDRESEGDEPT